jgi:dipeptidyl aminopeptidase/acylaminoacyl peptidase
MIRRVVWVTAALLALFLAPSTAIAQRPMGIVDLINVPRIGDPQLSPDGASVLYTESRPDWKISKRVTHIWRQPLTGGEPQQLTTGVESETAPRWSPDGRQIAFVTKRGDNEFAQLYLLAADGGEARQLTSHTSAVSSPTWAPDGSAIYFVASEPKTDEERARERAKDDVYGFDEDFKNSHLWKVVVNGRAESRVTSGDFSVEGYDLSANGRTIAYQRAPTPLVESSDEAEVWTMHADGSNAVRLTTNSVGEDSIRISPDGSQVLFVADVNSKFEEYHNGRLFVIPAAGGTSRVMVGESEPYDVESAVWSKDGASIYFIVSLGARQELFVAPSKGGALRQLTDGPHVVASVAAATNRLALSISDATNAGDIWVYAPGDSSPKRVTHVYDYLTREFTLGKQEAVQWKGADGTTVEGILTYPAGYQAGQKYPLSVMTHGGPQAADHYSVGSWAYAVQVLAGKGYAVLQPNYRGSTGYGDAFLRDMIGHYFENAHLDVMAGVDELVRRGIADPDRLVKSGWSAGGHMTNKIITFTSRFKAASSGAGAAEWISMYAQSDVRFTRTPWFGGTPWQKDAPIEKYWNNSPLKDVAKVTTPTIFFVGEKDARVPMPQSVEMHRALKSNGVPTALYIAPREPHSWAEPRHQLTRLNLEIEWFEKYVTRRPYTWEKAPGESGEAPKPSTAGQP